MGLISDPARSQGDVMRRLREMEKRVQRLEAMRRLEAASIGAGGLRVTNGGRITVEDADGIAVDLATLAFGIRAGRVLASEFTTQSVFGDLDTPGPSVEVEIGPSRRAFAFISCSAGAGPGTSAAASVEVSGASSLDPETLSYMAAFITSTGDAAQTIDASATSLVLLDASDGLSEGMNTFTLKYANTGSAGTVAFKDRKLVVLPY
ncbi:MAG: hypothetical protein ACRD0P_14685 [Stackebrandtia sp.]